MRKIFIALFILLLAVSAQAQVDTLRLCTYNILNFPSSGDPDRIDDIAAVVQAVNADLYLIQECQSAGVDIFIDEALVDEGWVSAGHALNTSRDAILFYNSNQFDMTNSWTIETDLRNIEVYELTYLAQEQSPPLYLSSTHLKASQGSEEEARRLLEVNTLLDFMENNELETSNFIFGGDLNLYDSYEPAYEALLENDLFLDPIDRPGNWHNTASFADIHTQSPRVDQFGGGSTGGMDDRFDIMVATEQLFDEEYWEYLPESYIPFGNDGNHFNLAINDGTNSAVSAQMANSIHDAADHLPVYMDLLYIPDTYVKEFDPVVVSEFALATVYPNPFNNHATLNVELPQANRLDITLYDMLGRSVQKVASGQYSQGIQQFSINGTMMSSGTYFVTISAGDQSISQRVILLK